MNNPGLNRLVELAWRRKLTAAEQEELRGLLALHPEVLPDFESELSLSDRLQRLPDIAVPSNFTARVLSAIELDERAAARSESRFRTFLYSFQRRWLPRLAFGAVVITAGLFTYHHQHAVTIRRQYAQSVAAVSDISTLPSPEVLQNFETIRQLNNAPGPDEQLLTLLQ